MSGEREPRVKLMTLREYVTSDGRPYFRGWLGDAVVLVFRSEDAESEYGSLATWEAFVVPRKPKSSEPTAAPKPPRRSAPKHGKRQLKLVAAQGSRNHPGLDDEIGF